ncbi:MAG: ECF transporter S component [Clostridia bacterium]|nr:ECF transporter S component [Clostridia bacterium]
MTDIAKKSKSVYWLTVTAVMAALAFVANYIRFPFLGSQITISNTVCQLCGLILGPSAGFLSAGLGNLLYDLLTGYGIESLITFVSKGAIALVVALLTASFRKKVKLEKAEHVRMVVACAVAALTYVALYMLKTFIFGLAVNGLTLDGTFAKMLSKLPASLINAVFATVVAPVFLRAVLPALRRTGLLEKL